MYTLKMDAQLPYKDNMDFEKLKQSGKQNIIKEAITYIKTENDLDIKPSDFHYCKVLASQKKLKVIFGFNTIYLPLNSSYYTSIVLELPSKNISYDIKSNGDSFTATSVYKANTDHLNVIRFIFGDKLSLDTIFNRGNEGNLTVITDQGDHYNVKHTSRYPHLGGGYTIEEVDKVNGQVISTLNGHYASYQLPHQEEEHFMEITN